MSLASKTISGKRIVLVDVMDTLLSPSFGGGGYQVRAGACEFFDWCDENGIIVGVHSDISSEKIRRLFDDCGLEGVDYFWGSKKYNNVSVKLQSGMSALAKNFPRMLGEAGCSTEDSVIISDGDVEAARRANVELIEVPHFGLEKLSGEIFDFRSLTPSYSSQRS